MKLMIFAVLLAAVVGAGCVRTVTDRSTGGIPFTKDKVDGRYNRPIEQVFEAAKEVVRVNGALINETVDYKSTNAVRTVQGRVQNQNVWMRIVAVEPAVTAITVQVRTQGGSPDIYMAHELEKQVALKLVR